MTRILHLCLFLSPVLTCSSIVFSTWRTSLDVVEVGLIQAGILCLRYDGKVPQRERHSVVTRFRQDPSVWVLLLTLACGAVGYANDTAYFF